MTAAGLLALERVAGEPMSDFLRRELFEPLGADVSLGTPASEDHRVAALRIEDPPALVSYHDAVAARSLALLGRLSDGDLDVVVDESWDPPVTAGVRWVSIIEDCFEHLGQAAYVRGLLP